MLTLKYVAVCVVFALLAVSCQASGGGNSVSSCKDADLIAYLNTEVQAWKDECQTKGLEPPSAKVTSDACCTRKGTTRCPDISDPMEWAEGFAPAKDKVSGNAVCTTKCLEAVQNMAWHTCFWANWNAIEKNNEGKYTKKKDDCCPDDSCSEGDSEAAAKAENGDCYFKADGCINQEQINAWGFAGIVGDGGCMKGVNWGLTLATAMGSSVVGLLGTALIGQLSMWKRGPSKAGKVVEEADDGITEDDAVVGAYEG